MRAAIRSLVATLATGCVFFSHGPEVHELERQSLLVSSDMRVHDTDVGDFAQLDWQPRALAHYHVAGDGGHIGIYTSGSGGEI
jgi:hypothetical protein